MVKNTDFYTFFGFLNGGLSFLWTFIVNVSHAFLTVFPWRFPPSPWNLRQDAQLVADRLSTVPRIRRGAWKGSRSAAREDDILIHGYGSIPMKIPFLVGWTSINPSYFDVNYRGTRFWHTATFSWEWNSWNSWKYGMKIWDENMGTPEVWSPVFETILWIHGVRVCQGHSKNFPSTTMNGYVFQKNCSDPFLSPWPGLIFLLEGLVGTATDRWTKYLLHLNLQSASCSSLP